MELVRRNIARMQKMASVIEVDNFDAVCDFYGVQRWSKKFCEDDILDIQTTLKISLKFYEDNDGAITPIYAPVVSKYDIIIRLLRRGEKYFLIGNESVIPKRFYCKMTPNCRYYTDKDIDHLKRHQEKCLELSTQQICSKQKSYGASPSILEELIKAKILPNEARHYRKRMFVTYDIETVEIKDTSEQKSHGLSVIGTNIVCSIGKSDKFT